jgi:hypothetical protein
MARWNLKQNCCFVEAYKDKNNTKLDQLQKARLLHKKGDRDYTCLEFSDDAAFVARFIVQGVDTDLIQQILLSEYTGLEAQDAQGYVTYVYNQLQPYLVPAGRKPLKPPLDVSENPDAETSFPLDFKVNWIGNIVFKG